MEQLLKRKRAEIVDLWEERESNLRKIRAREVMMEERERKRRRYGEDASRKEANDADDEEDEWLLDGEHDEDTPRFSDIRKEETDDSTDEDQVKVYLSAFRYYLRPF